MDIDTTNWTGEGTFTPVLLDALKGIDAIDFLRLEDAPASRADAGFAFLSHEIYVRFKSEPTTEVTRKFGFPWKTTTLVPVMTLAGLSALLAGIEGVGVPDYEDEGMLQYLRTERLVSPYQTKGLKVVEMIRIYLAGTIPRRES